MYIHYIHCTNNANGERGEWDVPLSDITMEQKRQFLTPFRKSEDADGFSRWEKYAWDFRALQIKQ